MLAYYLLIAVRYTFPQTVHPPPRQRIWAWTVYSSPLPPLTLLWMFYVVADGRLAMPPRLWNDVLPPEF
jgi:hypothetical protein